MPLQDTIVSAIRQAIPQDALVDDVVSSRFGFYVNVSWPLHDDPNRRFKMSKTISIHVPKDVEDDYANASEQLQSQAHDCRCWRTLTVVPVNSRTSFR